jgi:hypothetical protein
MSTERGEAPDSHDPDLFQEKYLHRLSHRGRMVRLLSALLLTALALVPVPYIGWGGGVVLLGPASVLLAVAARDRKSCRMVLLWSIPTAVGMVLSLFSLAGYSSRGVSTDVFFGVIGIALLTTLIAALLGRTPSGT